MTDWVAPESGWYQWGDPPRKLSDDEVGSVREDDEQPVYEAGRSEVDWERMRMLRATRAVEAGALEAALPGTQWVRVEFYGLVPYGQVMTGLDPLETGETLMRAFGFTHIDALTVVAEQPHAPSPA